MVAYGTFDRGAVRVWQSEYGFVYSTNPGLTGPGTMQGIVPRIEEIPSLGLSIYYKTGSPGFPGRWLARPSRNFQWGIIPEGDPWYSVVVTFWDEEFHQGFLAASGAAGFFRRKTSQPDAEPLGYELPPIGEEFVGKPYVSTITRCGKR